MMNLIIGLAVINSIFIAIYSIHKEKIIDNYFESEEF